MALFQKKREVIEVRQIVAATLWDYSQDLQKAVLDGFELSDQSKYFPAEIGYTKTVSLVKYAPEVPVEPKPLSPEKQEALEKFGDQAGAAKEELAAQDKPARGRRKQG